MLVSGRWCAPGSQVDHWLNLMLPAPGDDDAMHIPVGSGSDYAMHIPVGSGSDDAMHIPVGSGSGVDAMRMMPVGSESGVDAMHIPGSSDYDDHDDVLSDAPDDADDTDNTDDEQRRDDVMLFQQRLNKLRREEARDCRQLEKVRGAIADEMQRCKREPAIHFGYLCRSMPDMKNAADMIASGAVNVYIGGTVQALRRWNGWASDEYRQGCIGHRHRWTGMEILSACLDGTGPNVEKTLINYMLYQSNYRQIVVNKAPDSRGLVRTGTVYIYCCFSRISDQELEQYIE